jgi:hypothetical protein
VGRIYRWKAEKKNAREQPRLDANHCHHCRPLPITADHCQSLPITANHCQSLPITANHLRVVSTPTINRSASRRAVFVVADSSQVMRLLSMWLAASDKLFGRTTQRRARCLVLQTTPSDIQYSGLRRVTLLVAETSLYS